jgi:hypothetical protein
VGESIVVCKWRNMGIKYVATSAASINYVLMRGNEIQEFISIIMGRSLIT